MINRNHLKCQLQLTSSVSQLNSAFIGTARKLSGLIGNVWYGCCEGVGNMRALYLPILTVFPSLNSLISPTAIQSNV